MNNIKALSTKHCLICKGGHKNACLHWHMGDDGMPWVYCVGKCQRAYSIYQYTATAGVSLADFLKLDFDFRESPPNEVRKMDWPKNFLPMYDARSKKGVDYIQSRGIDPDDNMYYDVEAEAIVFPYYYDAVFCGAQMRLTKPYVDEYGDERKILTLPGTRLGLLFYNWNQQKFNSNIKAVILTEGAFNALAIQQALAPLYGSVLENPWKCIALSGSGVSAHQVDALIELKEAGYKVIAAPDYDVAGIKMLKKLLHHNAITHYALTGDNRIDWNDAGKAMGKTDFAKWFLKRISIVKRT